MSKGRGSKHWNNGLVEWLNHDKMEAYISIAFSWKLPEAYQRAYWYGLEGYKVYAGGPATFTNKDYLKGVAKLGGSVNDAIGWHSNGNATIASRGCPVGCSWCIVSAMEGKEFTLLPDFTPRNILCDNNVSALPVEYQLHIIDKYKSSGVDLLDINSGFEPRSFDEDTYRRWKEIYNGRLVMWRFAYDENKEENEAYRMSQILKNENSRNKRVFVLIGNEPFESCYRRVLQVIEWGCEPHVQPVYALNTLEKKHMVKFDWTDQKLKDLARWANRWMWRSVKFEDYDRFKTVSRKSKKKYTNGVLWNS